MQKLIIDILMKAFGLLSPEMRKTLLAFIADLETKAKLTQNPWDDVFVFVLKLIVGE